MRFFCTAVILLISFASTFANAQDPASFPNAKAFEPGSGKLWFAGCVYEAERYVSCKTAQAGVLEAISQPGDQTPGAALQMFVSDVFIEKGCSFEAPPESFRVNGVFLSFDTKSAAAIRCKGKKSALAFAPDGMSLIDTLYFFSGDPPQ